MNLIINNTFLKKVNEFIRNESWFTSFLITSFIKFFISLLINPQNLLYQYEE